MIIAVATDNEMVAQHFGRCPEYTLFRLAENTIAEEQTIQNPGHEPGFLPGYLADKGVKCIIAGGMGPRAKSLFDDHSIETYIGVTGPVKDVIEAYLSGELKSGPSACEHPDGHHGCS